MLWSSQALLALARRRVPRALGSLWSWPAVPELAGILRVQAASAAGIECPLGRDHANLDFAVHVGAASDGRRRLASVMSGLSPDRAGPHWGSPMRFVASWNDAATAPARAVPSIWLEYDHALVAAQQPAPFVTFMLDQELVREARSSAGARRHLDRGIREGLEALSGGHGDRLLALVSRGCAPLPAGGSLLHLAAMPHRGFRGVRAITAQRLVDVPGYLTRLGWRGSSAALAADLDGLAPPGSMVSLHVDLDPDVSDRVALELYWPTTPREDERWRHLLEGLVTRESCTAAQRDALLSWGTEVERGRLAWMEEQLLVKLVYEPGRPLTAKAYLGFMPRSMLGGNPGA